eukprot:CAMPEP_0177667344 /NCGR_PEP_ID=MMETSP0447-20121125/22072_1 /TAXON_ID=0 /ORGANISM="Stygamoeba regulata, Strain BSH-02190019" /LENGTH=235 /DNA_ID=CAMNT_0019173567 /DNA_START=15 /DNA_END=722 /DNA_ORIENTATION=-
MASAKHQKVEEEEHVDVPPEYEAISEELQNLYHDIGEIEQETSKLVEEIVRKQNVKKLPLYEKRAKIFSKVPGFWKRTLMNHPLFGDVLEKEDLEILDHLEDVKFESPSEDVEKLVFYFKPNPYFSNRTIWKEVTYKDDDATTKSSKIEWKPGMNVIQNVEKKSVGEKRSSPPASFFTWFEPEETDVFLLGQFKEHIWPAPHLIFEGMVDDEISFEEDEEEEDDDKEDGEEGSDE